ncbi:MAG: type II toxin-antitoxin system VapC family toxin [Phycisphaerales bacterium]|jgi:predicted nucleic acid-binding protein|nr:type II toxin-antitoxin system VapC family toxin [Phycisphaerales bacterium]
MAILFLDSSAVVKRYVAEAGTGWVIGLTTPSAGNVIHISVMTGAEVIAAFARRRQIGSMTPDDVERAIAEFYEDWAVLYELVRADREVVNRAMLLARRHGLRGYDSVQLASAIEVNALAKQATVAFRFISADEDLNVAAQAEGLQTENPNLHP